MHPVGRSEPDERRRIRRRRTRAGRRRPRRDDLERGRRRRRRRSTTTTDDIECSTTRSTTTSPEVPVPVVTDAAADRRDRPRRRTTRTRRRRPRRGAAPRRRRGAARRAAAGAHRERQLEDDEEELEDEEARRRRPGRRPDQDRAAAPRRVPLPVVLPRAAAPSARRPEAAVLRRLRLSGCACARDTGRPVSGRTDAPSELGAPRRRARRRRAHRAVLPAGRPRAGRARRARPAAVGVARRAPGARARCTASCSARACYGVVIPWIRYFGLRRHRPAGRRDGARASRRVGALVGRVGRRGCASPLLTAAVWVVLEALRGRWPLGGFPWGELGVALHDLPPARALASVGGALLVCFLVVAVERAPARPRASRCDAQRTRGARARRRRRRRRPGGAPSVVDVTPLRARPDRPAPGRAAPGQRRTAAAARRAGEPAAHREPLRARRPAARRLRPHRVPGVVARHRSRARPAACAAGSSRSPTEHDAAVLVERASTPGDRRPALQHQPALRRPTGSCRARTRSSTSCRSASTCRWRDAARVRCRSCGRCPTTSSPATARRCSTSAGHPFGSVICFESAFAPLVRDFVRDGAEVDRGDHEQPLVPAVGQLRAAPRARPDARGRDRAGRCCRPRCRGSAR